MNSARGAFKAESPGESGATLEPDLGNANVGKRILSLPAVSSFYFGKNMQVVLNGQETQIPDLSDVRALIDSKQLQPESVMVCLNEEVIPRSLWAQTVIKEHDRIDVVRIVGGG